MTSNPRAIVQAAFQFEETADIPYWLPMDDDVRQQVNEYYGSTDWQERLTPYLMGGFPVNSRGHVDLGDGRLRDPYGSIYRPGNIAHNEVPALSAPSLKGYCWPRAEDLVDWDALRRQYEAWPNTYRLCGMGYGLFERSWNMRGFQDLLVDMVEQPQFVEELMDGYTELHLQVYDLLAARVPFEAFYGWGDDCDQRGPMMGMARWRRFIKPRMARIIDHAHKLGKPFVAHMCGNVAPLIDDCLEIGLDALESLQPEAMDVYALKRKVAGKLVLIGGMGNQTTLPFGTPDQVRTEARRLKRELGRGGGYVLGPAKNMMRDIPIQNVVAFIEAAMEAGKH